MRQTIVKKPRKAKLKPAVQDKPSKPKPTGLSKSDPEFYSKLGRISAARRNISSEVFSQWAKLSHVGRTSYHGGRKKKNVTVAEPDRNSKPASDNS